VNRVIAIIPARGGSKRLPKKNILHFCGKPLLAWTIEAAQGAGVFDRIVVSTDSEEIASVARDWGAEVPFLRDAYADDHSPVSSATIAALRQCKLFYGEDYEQVVQLMPNCPLRTAKDIVEALQHYAAHEATPQISSFRFGWMNPWWAVTLDEQLHPAPLFPRTRGQRSQDLPTLYCPSGAIWISPVPRLIQAGTFYSDGYIFHPMRWEAAIDIDDEEDLRMARSLFAMSREQAV